MDQAVSSRRIFLHQLLGLSSVASVAGVAACAGSPDTAESPAGNALTQDAANSFSCMDTAGLTQQEIAARTTLKYVDQSPVEGKNCENCALYVAAADGAQCGTCLTIKGPIHPEGYCDIWAALTA